MKLKALKGYRVLIWAKRERFTSIALHEKERERERAGKYKKEIRFCLVTVFVFYFQKLVFGNIKKKKFSCIFEIKNMFG